MKIIPYEIKESLYVSELFREIFTETGWEEQASDHTDNPHLLFYGGLFLLVKENNKVIGTAGITLLTKTDGLIKRFYISKSYRGTQIAQQLLDELVKKAKLLDLKRLILNVSKNNSRAVDFYEKNGFISMGVKPQKGWPESYLPDTHSYFYKMID